MDAIAYYLPPALKSLAILVVGGTVLQAIAPMTLPAHALTLLMFGAVAWIWRSAVKARSR